MEHRTHQPCESYCVLRVGASWFALPALAVREICPAGKPVRLPDSPALLAGIVHLRNEFLAVVRLDDLAGEGEGETQPERQLLVLSGPNSPWAVLVDEVAALAPLEVSVDGEAKTPDSWAAVVLGSATFRERVVRALDPNRLHRLAEQELSREWDRLGTPSVVVPARSALEGVDPGRRFGRGANNDCGTSVVEGGED